VNANTATIRQLRTDFRSVKRSIEQHGEVVVTDHGEPAYVIKLLPAPAKKRRPLPDYYARLRKRQPKGFSTEETRQFWEEERR
jgi:antitoxin (DNA-binding transcriptional repressor) of toxin-antitoxin stability system